MFKSAVIQANNAVIPVNSPVIPPIININKSTSKLDLFIDLMISQEFCYHASRDYLINGSVNEYLENKLDPAKFLPALRYSEDINFGPFVLRETDYKVRHEINKLIYPMIHVFKENNSVLDYNYKTKLITAYEKSTSLLNKLKGDKKVFSQLKDYLSYVKDFFLNTKERVKDINEFNNYYSRINSLTEKFNDLGLEDKLKDLSENDSIKIIEELFPFLKSNKGWSFSKRTKVFALLTGLILSSQLISVASAIRAAREVNDADRYIMETFDLNDDGIDETIKIYYSKFGKCSDKELIVQLNGVDLNGSPSSFEKYFVEGSSGTDYMTITDLGEGKFDYVIVKNGVEYNLNGVESLPGTIWPKIFLPESCISVDNNKLNIKGPMGEYIKTNECGYEFNAILENKCTTTSTSSINELPPFRLPEWFFPVIITGSAVGACFMSCSGYNKLRTKSKINKTNKKKDNDKEPVIGDVEFILDS